MTRRVTDEVAVQQFMLSARKYRDLIDRRSKLSGVKVLQELHPLLPELCLGAQRLPNIQRFDSFKGSQAYEEWQKLYRSLGSKLKGIDVYWEVFDPYADEKSRDPVAGMLSNDLADIYRELVPGLEAWEHAQAAKRRGIVWDWKFSYKHHWGYHALDALRAVYWLVCQKIDDDDLVV